MVRSPEARKQSAKSKKTEQASKAKGNGRKATSHKNGAPRVENLFRNVHTLEAEKYMKEEKLTLAINESGVNTQMARLNIDEAENERQNVKWSTNLSAEEETWYRYPYGLSSCDVKNGECEDNNEVVQGTEYLEQTNEIVHNAASLENYFKHERLSGTNCPFVGGENNKRLQTCPEDKPMEHIYESNDLAQGSNDPRKGYFNRTSTRQKKQNYFRKKKSMVSEYSTSSSDDDIDRRMAMRLSRTQVPTSTPVPSNTSDNSVFKTKLAVEIVGGFGQNRTAEKAKKNVIPVNPTVRNNYDVGAPSYLPNNQFQNSSRIRYPAAPSYPQNVSKSYENSRYHQPHVPYNNVQPSNQPSPRPFLSQTPQNRHRPPIIPPTPVYYSAQHCQIVNPYDSHLSNFIPQNFETKFNDVPLANPFSQQYVQILSPQYSAVNSNGASYQHPTNSFLFTPTHASYYPPQDTVYTNSQNCQAMLPTQENVSATNGNVPLTNGMEVNRYQNVYVAEENQQPIYNDTTTFSMYNPMPKLTDHLEQNTNTTDQNSFFQQLDSYYGQFNCANQMNNAQMPSTNPRDCLECEYSRVQAENLQMNYQFEEGYFNGH